MIRVARLTAPRGAAELAADRLWAAGAQAVEELEVSGDSERVALCTVLAADDAVSRDRLGVLPAGWELSFVDQDPAPAETWRRFAAPVVVSPSLTIRPAWLPARAGGGLEVAIEPGGAFGLGDHPTTRLSAAAVERLAGPAVARALDVGSGSGVLAVIAALRGVPRVVAIDVADAACEATRDNAERNGVGAAVDASTRPLADVADTSGGTFGLVLANILAPALVALADDLRRCLAPGGTLVVSGVLAGSHDHVLAALEPLRPVRTDELDGWAAVELRQPA